MNISQVSPFLCKLSANCLKQSTSVTRLLWTWMSATEILELSSEINDALHFFRHFCTKQSHKPSPLFHLQPESCASGCLHKSPNICMHRIPIRCGAKRILLLKCISLLFVSSPSQLMKDPGLLLDFCELLDPVLAILQLSGDPNQADLHTKSPGC